MLKLKIFLVLSLFCNLWAIPFNIETAQSGEGDEIVAGQLIQVHYKGFLILDSLQMAEYAQLEAETAPADSTTAKDATKTAEPTKTVDSTKTADSSVVNVDSLNRYKDKRLFSSSYESGQPLEFTLGIGQVIPGWEKGLLGMKVGEIRYLTVPAVLAYGDRSLEGIPANSDLYFEVELIHAEKPLEPDVFPQDIEKLPWKESAKGLKIYDEKVGTGKPSAVGAQLKTHYTGWLLNGRKFGSSKDMGKPFEVTMGMGKLIKGWEAGLEGMREGGVRWLRISPAMGYGAKAYTMVPSNSTLIYRIELKASEVDPEIAEKMDFFPDTTALTFENGSEGLRYAIVKQGEGEPAKTGSSVRVHYTGWLTNGFKFDSSRDRNQEFVFPLGGGRVIRGWDLGVAGMLPGEKRILIVPPGLGYGSRGAGPIPGGSTLIFAVEYLGD